ncbi:MAG: tRNA pseudouridine(55) synthase TruB [Deltaproteobacteria bacterium]|nr:tRNA pseudouridine(55) synthase TruB [Deltaproteobacteria bacterium]
MDAFLVIDKPEGPTSHDVVKAVQRLTAARRAGHTGTLDPSATGVLVVALDRATRVVAFLPEGEKTYVGCLRLGVETDTQDATGRVVREGGDIPRDEAAVEDAFRAFEGRIRQVPPMYSAVKVAGRPLYQRARRGEEIERPAREVEISKLRVLEMALPEVTFEVTCSRGTYVRALCADIGRRLGCGAHLTRLRRTGSGEFTLSQAVTLEELARLVAAGTWQAWAIPMAQALAVYPRVEVPGALEARVRCGTTVPLEMLTGTQGVPSAGSRVRLMSPTGELLALAEVVREEPASGQAPGRPAIRYLRVLADR